MANKEIQILVVTHKDFQLMTNDDMYIPMLVGPQKDGLNFTKYYRDDTKDSISGKNANYSELTGLYWAWKNLNSDYVGLVHYRRYLMSKKDKKNIISKKELSEILDSVDVVLPKKRNYYIETTWSHYEHNHNIDDLIKTREIIATYYPRYVDSFDKIMTNKKSHRFNMLIMKKEKFDAYCNWLFDILFELEKTIDISDYNSYQSRIYGFISERLLDVWLETNEVFYKEVPFKFTERQNWIKKGGKFILNKMGMVDNNG